MNACIPGKAGKRQLLPQLPDGQKRGSLTGSSQPAESMPAAGGLNQLPVSSTGMACGVQQMISRQEGLSDRLQCEHHVCNPSEKVQVPVALLVLR